MSSTTVSILLTRFRAKHSGGVENNTKYCFIVLYQLCMEFIDESTQFYKLLCKKHRKNIYTTVMFAWNAVLKPWQVARLHKIFEDMITRTEPIALNIQHY